MNYPIPANRQEMLALGTKPITEDIIAVAIAGVVKIARQKGQSLEDLQAEVLQDDLVLDIVQRRWLRDSIVKAWDIV